MVTKDQLLLHDELVVDRALAFCILGGEQQLPLIRRLGTNTGGVLFVASLMLPFNIAALLIMMATAPREIANFDLPRIPFDSISCTEVSKVLPILSVACAHANFLVNSVVSFWPEKALHSVLVLPPVSVSGTFRHDNALMIWDALRSGRNLEYLGSQDNFVSDDDSNVSEYLSNCFSDLRRLRRQDAEWMDLIKKWQADATPVYKAWWEIFNLDEAEFPGAVSTSQQSKEKNSTAQRNHSKNSPSDF